MKGGGSIKKVNKKINNTKSKAIYACDCCNSELEVSKKKVK